MLIRLEDVTQWLEDTKSQLTVLPSDLVQTAEELILGKLAAVYDVSEWVDSSTTPHVVKTAIGMYVAGSYYLRQYSEQDTDSDHYGRQLKQWSGELVSAVVDGSIVLLDDPSDQQPSHSRPAFSPDDKTEPSAAFTMGKRF